MHNNMMLVRCEKGANARVLKITRIIRITVISIPCLKKYETDMLRTCHRYVTDMLRTCHGHVTHMLRTC